MPGYPRQTRNKHRCCLPALAGFTSPRSMGPGSNKLGSGIPVEQGEFPESSVPTRYGIFEAEQIEPPRPGTRISWKIIAQTFDKSPARRADRRNRSHLLPIEGPAPQWTASTSGESTVIRSHRSTQTPVVCVELKRASTVPVIFAATPLNTRNKRIVSECSWARTSVLGLF